MLFKKLVRQILNAVMYGVWGTCIKGIFTGVIFTGGILPWVIYVPIGIAIFMVLLAAACHVFRDDDYHPYKWNIAGRYWKLNAEKGNE